LLLLYKSRVRHVIVTNGRELKPMVLWWPSNLWRHISWHSVWRFNRWSERRKGQTESTVIWVA